MEDKSPKTETIDIIVAEPAPADNGVNVVLQVFRRVAEGIFVVLFFMYLANIEILRFGAGVISSNTSFSFDFGSHIFATSFALLSSFIFSMATNLFIALCGGFVFGGGTFVFLILLNSGSSTVPTLEDSEQG